MASWSDSERQLFHRPVSPGDSQSDTGTDTESDLTSSTDSSQLNTVKAKAPTGAQSPGHSSDTDSDKESTCSSLVFEYSLIPIDDSAGEAEGTEVTLLRSKPKDHNGCTDSDNNNNLPRRNSSRKSKQDRPSMSASGQSDKHKSRSRSAYSSSSSSDSNVDEDIIDTTLRTADQNSHPEVDTVDNCFELEPPAQFSDEKSLSNSTPIPEKDSPPSSGSDKEGGTEGVDSGCKGSESGAEASVSTVDENHLNAIYQVSLAHVESFLILNQSKIGSTLSIYHMMLRILHLHLCFGSQPHIMFFALVILNTLRVIVSS